MPGQFFTPRETPPTPQEAEHLLRRLCSTSRSRELASAALAQPVADRTALEEAVRGQLKRYTVDLPPSELRLRESVRCPISDDPRFARLHRVMLYLHFRHNPHGRVTVEANGVPVWTARLELGAHSWGHVLCQSEVTLRRWRPPALSQPVKPPGQAGPLATAAAKLYRSPRNGQLARWRRIDQMLSPAKRHAR